MSQTKQLALFAFIDAFGWRIFEEHGFLDDRLQTTRPLQTVLGYSCACDPTILTGELPNVHGHFSFFRYDPPASPFRSWSWLGLLPQAVTRRQFVRRRLSKFIQKLNGFDGYFQIYNVPFNRLAYFDYSEKKDLYRPGGIINGSPTIFDYLRENDVPFACSDWRNNEANNIAGMIEQLRRGEISFGYLYLAELDGIMHADGVGSSRVAKKIAWYDQQFRDLLDVADSQYDQVRLYVFSDHGMTDVQENVNLIAEIESLGLRFGIDYAAMYDSTMARFWSLSDKADERLRGRLNRLDYGRVLTDEELRSYGAFFQDRSYGEIIFLVRPGALITPSYMNHGHVPGMHGYDPAHEDSTALFASTAILDAPPERLDDLYPLMRREAEICGGLDLPQSAELGSQFVEQGA